MITHLYIFHNMRLQKSVKKKDNRGRYCDDFGDIIYVHVGKDKR